MINHLLAGNEGKTLEFKANVKAMNGILKTVIAFANTAGGVLVIGVEDKTKRVVGVNDALQEEERLTSALADSITPLLLPDIEICPADGKEVLILRIPHLAGPFFLKSEGIEKGTFVRFGSTNRQADAEMLSALRLLAENRSFDELPSLKGTIDPAIMQDVFAWIDKKPTKQISENLGLITESSGKNYPTNGGVLLFSSQRLKFFPDSIIRCARFGGITKETIEDHAEIEVPLPLAIDQTISFIERNIRKSAKIGRMLREDVLEYPPFAIREAVINAVLHADYSMRGCQIQIAIFDDRIEFSNPGGLPFGQTLEKAIAGSSKLRNRVIGRMFRELKLIEQWGSGLQRIFATCKKQGLKHPLVEDLNNQFKLTLYSTQIEEIMLEPWGKILFRYFQEEGEITPRGAAKIWKVSIRTARARLRSLQEHGFILRIGKSLSDPNVKFIQNRKFG